MMAAIDSLTKLGYTVGAAYGDAQPEHDRLGELKAATTDAALAAAADDVAAEVADMLAGTDMPVAAKAALIARATAQALAALQTHAADAVAHQERAVDIAENMVTVYRVEGHGLSILVSEDDTDTIAALADKTAHAERVAQHKAT
jgi:hypothetical protein